MYLDVLLDARSFLDIIRTPKANRYTALVRTMIGLHPAAVSCSMPPGDHDSTAVQLDSVRLCPKDVHWMTRLQCGLMIGLASVCASNNTGQKKSGRWLEVCLLGV
jgi:hypothetical protein